nr:hypothetical protein [Tanacetum cinerariifolium]
LKIQRVLMMMDSNLQVMMKRRLMKIQLKEVNDQQKEDKVNITNNVNAAGINGVNAVGKNISSELPFDPDMHALEDISIFNFSSDHKDDDAMDDMYNLITTI